MNSLLETTPLMNIKEWKSKVETLQPSQSVVLPSVEKAPQLELKTLPNSLKYAFLGLSKTLPVIIASDLDKE